MSLFWSLGFGLAVFAVFFLGGGAFIDFVSTNPDVRAYAREFLVFAALTPLVGAAAFAFDGIYIGATWTAAMRNLMLVALRAVHRRAVPACGRSGQYGPVDRVSGVPRARAERTGAALCPRLTRANLLARPA